MTSLATRFSKSSRVLRSDVPLSDEQIRAVAPSIFATSAHISRSDRYTRIPTSEVLAALRGQSFMPFMVCQSRSRLPGRAEFTKHLIRLRHASQITSAEAHEIVLVNSHDGSSSYQLMSGLLRFVCQNGLVCGDTLTDVRIPHKGDVTERVIEGAFRVLDEVPRVAGQVEAMKAIPLSSDEQRVFARAALELRFDVGESRPAPVTENQVLEVRRSADADDSLWVIFNRLQECLVRGGLQSRNHNGRRRTTRPVEGIDGNLKLNRALWLLAEGMQKLKA
jgi:hypothetical protein